MKKTAKWKVESGRFPLLKRRYDDYVQWCSNQLGVGRGSSAVMGFSDYCARVIQVWWRTARACHPTDRETVSWCIRCYYTRKRLLEIWPNKCIGFVHMNMN